MISIAIFSLELDLHAHAIVHSLGTRDDVVCHFVATDALVGHGGLVWKNGDKKQNRLLSYENKWFNISDMDLIWWRRVNQPQQINGEIEDLARIEIINNEWKGGLAGVVLDGFKGIWVNDPYADMKAENKVFQLNVAHEVGLKIPETLISQDPDSIIEFCKKMGGRIVLKKIAGIITKPLATVVVTTEQLEQVPHSLKTCPAIYQEIIKADYHIRANCFGDEVHSIMIKSELLDWRRNLKIPFLPYKLDKEIEKKLVRLLKKFRLKMGIMDLIVNEKGETIWLEINPQGQFLFGEALSGYDLTNPFTDFLYKTAKKNKKSSNRVGRAEP